MRITIFGNPDPLLSWFHLKYASSWRGIHLFAGSPLIRSFTQLHKKMQPQRIIYVEKTRAWRGRALGKLLASRKYDGIYFTNCFSNKTKTKAFPSVIVYVYFYRRLPQKPDIILRLRNNKFPKKNCILNLSRVFRISSSLQPCCSRIKSSSLMTRVICIFCQGFYKLQFCTMVLFYFSLLKIKI